MNKKDLLSGISGKYYVNKKYYIIRVGRELLIKRVEKDE